MLGIENIGRVAVLSKDRIVLINADPDAGEGILGRRFRAIAEIGVAARGSNEGGSGKADRHCVKGGGAEGIERDDVFRAVLGFLFGRAFDAESRVFVEDDVFDLKIGERFGGLVLDGYRVCPLSGFRIDVIVAGLARCGPHGKTLFLYLDVYVSVARPGDVKKEGEEKKDGDTTPGFHGGG